MTDFPGEREHVRIGSTDELRSVLARAVEPSEKIDLVAPAVGCTLVLTDRRLMVVREGASYRPASGVRSWPVDRTLKLYEVGTVRHGSRLAIVRNGVSASVFVLPEQGPAAQLLIHEVHRRIGAAAT